MRTMNVLWAVALLGGVGLAGGAAAGTWSAAYNGTIVSTYEDGRVVDVYVNADNTYAIVPRDGTQAMKGTWKDEAGQSCFTVTDPPQDNPQPVCFPIKEYKVGDSFQGEDSSGKFTGVIQAGRKM